MADKKVGRPKKPESLHELVLSGKSVDFSNYSTKQLGECITTLAKMFNDITNENVSLKELRQIKNTLKKQVEKLEKIAPEKSKDSNQEPTEMEETNPTEN